MSKYRIVKRKNFDGVEKHVAQIYTEYHSGIPNVWEDINYTNQTVSKEDALKEIARHRFYSNPPADEVVYTED